MITITNIPLQTHFRGRSGDGCEMWWARNNYRINVSFDSSAKNELVAAISRSCSRDL